MLTKETRRAFIVQIVNELAVDGKPEQQFRNEATYDDVLSGVTKIALQTRALADKLHSRSAKKTTRADAQKIAATVDKLKLLLWRASPELQTRIGVSKNARLFHELELIKTHCKQAVEAGKSAKGRSDEVKTQCANGAYLLMIGRSRKVLSNGSADEPFRAIAGLLHKYVYPTKVIPDLRRACGAVLKKHLRTNRAR